jgi:hypothetical protein
LYFEGPPKALGSRWGKQHHQPDLYAVHIEVQPKGLEIILFEHAQQITASSQHVRQHHEKASAVPFHFKRPNARLCVPKTLNGA